MNSAGEQPCFNGTQGNKCFMPGWWGLWGPSNATPDIVDRMMNCDPNVHFHRGPPRNQSQVGSSRSATLPKTCTTWIPARTGLDSHRCAHREEGDRGWFVAGIELAGKQGDLDLLPSFPGRFPAHANGTLEFNNFMTFFFEGCLPQNATGTETPSANCGTHDIWVGRFMGFANGTSTGPSPGTMVRILRLVE